LGRNVFRSAYGITRERGSTSPQKEHITKKKKGGWGGKKKRAPVGRSTMAGRLGGGKQKLRRTQVSQTVHKGGKKTWVTGRPGGVVREKVTNYDGGGTQKSGKQGKKKRKMFFLQGGAFIRTASEV